MVITDMKMSPSEAPYMADITVTFDDALAVSGLHLGLDESGSFYLVLPTVTDENGSNEKIVDFVSSSLAADIYLKAVYAFAE